MCFFLSFTILSRLFVVFYCVCSFVSAVYWFYSFIDLYFGTVCMMDSTNGVRDVHLSRSFDTADLEGRLKSEKKIKTSYPVGKEKSDSTALNGMSKKQKKASKKDKKQIDSQNSESEMSVSNESLPSATEVERRVISIVMRSAPSTTAGMEANSPSIVKIVFNSNTSYEALEKLTRIRCRLKNDQDFFLLDKEGLACALDGSLPSGTYYLKLQADSDSSDDDTIRRDASIEDKEEKDGSRAAVPQSSFTTYMNDKKVHIFKGHKFYAKHFHRIETCHYCKQALFGMGKQGYSCKDCGTIVHKKCYLRFPKECSEVPRKGEGLKCKKCRYRYIDDKNSETACRFHPELTEKHGWCRKCNEPFSSLGCETGFHEPKSVKKAKDKSQSSYQKLGGSGGANDGGFGMDASVIKCDCEDHFDKRFMNQVVPFSAKEFYDAFHGNDCPKMISFSESMGYENFSLEDWRPVKKGSTTSGDSFDDNDRIASGDYLERTISYDMPFNNPMTSTVKMVRTTEKQTLRWIAKDMCYAFELKASCPDVPYGEYFTTSTRYCVYSTVPGYCHVSSCAQPFFVKSTMMKSFIIRGCYGGVDNYTKKFVSYIESIADKPMVPPMSLTLNKAKSVDGLDPRQRSGSVNVNIGDKTEESGQTGLVEKVVKFISFLLSPFTFLFRLLINSVTGVASFTENWEQPSHMTVVLGLLVFMMFFLSCVVYMRILHLEEAILRLSPEIADLPDSS